MKSNVVRTENAIKPDSSPFKKIGIKSKKWTIVCGHKKCLKEFKVRLPEVDYPKVICPHCGIINEIPIAI